MPTPFYDLVDNTGFACSGRSSEEDGTQLSDEIFDYGAVAKAFLGGDKDLEVWGVLRKLEFLHAHGPREPLSLGLVPETQSEVAGWAFQALCAEKVRKTLVEPIFAVLGDHCADGPDIAEHTGFLDCLLPKVAA